MKHQLIKRQTIQVLSFLAFIVLALGTSRSMAQSEVRSGADPAAQSRRKVVLIRGTWNGSDFSVLKRSLKAIGYRTNDPQQDDDDILELDLSPNGKASLKQSVQGIRQQLLAHLRRPHVQESFPMDVDIIAHSAGGLAARWFLNEWNWTADGAAAQPICRAKNVITLGTPYGGVNGCRQFIARLLGGPIIKDMDPNQVFKNPRYGPFDQTSFPHTFFGAYGINGGTTYWGLVGISPKATPGNTDHSLGTKLGQWFYRLAGLTEPKMYDGLINTRSAYGVAPRHNLRPFCQKHFRMLAINHGDLPRSTEVIENFIVPILQGSKIAPCRTGMTFRSSGSSNQTAFEEDAVPAPNQVGVPSNGRWEFLESPAAPTQDNTLRTARSLEKDSGLAPDAEQEETPGVGVAAPTSPDSHLVESTELALRSGVQQTISVPLDSSPQAVFTLIAEADCELLLQAPDGTQSNQSDVVNASVVWEKGSDTSEIIGDQNNRARWQIVTISTPAPGIWKLLITSRHPTATVSNATLLAAVSDSPSISGSTEFVDYPHAAKPSLRVSLTGNSFLPQSIQISAVVTKFRPDLDATATSISVLAVDSTKELSFTLPLFDDGAHDDLGAGDGVFGGQLQTLEVAGIYNVQYKVSGLRQSAGLTIPQQFQRVATSFFTIAPASRSSARLSRTYRTLPSSTNRGANDSANQSVGASGPGMDFQTTLEGNLTRNLMVQADLVDAEGNLLETITRGVPAPAQRSADKRGSQRALTLHFSGESFTQRAQVGAVGATREDHAPRSTRSANSVMMRNVRLYEEIDGRPILVDTDKTTVPAQ